PREQLGYGERLDEIIVGAQVETAHAIVDAVAGRQDQHRRVDPLLTKRLQDVEAAPSRQHDVEHDEVEHFGARPEKPVFAVAGDRHLVVVARQRPGQHRGDFRFVFDDEDPHQEGCYRAAGACSLTFVSGTGTVSRAANGIPSRAENDPSRVGSASSRPYTTVYARWLGVNVPSTRSHTVSTFA